MKINGNSNAKEECMVPCGEKGTPKTAYLILENGTVFEGKYFGAEVPVTGEIAFTTSMTGYLETLTDNSNYKQIILQTFPLIGNYGVIPSDFESGSAAVSGYIVKSWCQEPSNFRSEGSIDAFLKSKNITGLYDIDTRALTKIIRENGTMNGRITGENPDSVNLDEIAAYKVTDAVKSVSVKKTEHYKSGNKSEDSRYKVALLDFGVKEGIKRELLDRGCDLWVFPYDSKAEDILKINPDGILLSNGPGDPAENPVVIENLKEIIGLKIPIFGVCLGHLLLALANGFRTEKLKYGHRGENQPVKDLRSGRVYITSQNHGYTVVPESVDTKTAAEVFVNVNDKTCEGLLYRNAPAFSVQFHPEGCGGPLDTAFLFDRFIMIMEENYDATR